MDLLGFSKIFPNNNSNNMIFNKNNYIIIIFISNNTNKQINNIDVWQQAFIHKSYSNLTHRYLLLF